MRPQNQQPTANHTKMMDFFLSLGANKEKAAEISEIIEKKNDYNLEPLSDENPDSIALQSPATRADLEIIRKDIRIFEISIKRDLEKIISDTDFKIEQLRTEAEKNKNELQKEIHNTNLKIEQLRTELIEKIAETKNELQKEIHNTKTELIKWMVTMQIGGFTATVLTLFALLKIFLPS